MSRHLAAQTKSSQKTRRGGATLGAHRQLFQIQFHEMFQIGREVLFGKLGEKLHFRAPVDLADAIDQFLLIHLYASQITRNARPERLGAYRRAPALFFSSPAMMAGKAP